MSLEIEQDKLEILFPAHICIDRGGFIVRCGASIRYHLGCDPVGHPLTRHFKVRKDSSVSARSGLKSMPSVVLTGKGAGEGLLLRGSASFKGDYILMFVSHAPFEAEGPAEPRTLRFEDFSPSDGSIDMMMATQLQYVLLHEARELSRGLVQKTKMAEAANVAKTQFLATMSHELRTPLNGILGMAQVLNSRDLSETDRHMVDIIEKSGDALLSILNDVLDISKIEAGRVEIDPINANFAKTVSQISDLHEASASEKGIGYTLMIEDDFPERAWIDARRAGQCVSNVIANAVKFTSSGSVSIFLGSADRDDGYDFTVIVRDTGIGIPPKAIGSLFERFTQADSSTTRRHGGTGLGLSIAKNMAQMMGGDVVVKSDEGVGSQFTVTVQAEKARNESDEMVSAA